MSNVTAFPGTGSGLAYTNGNTYWSNPSYIQTDDGSSATVTGSFYIHWLRASNFGFAIPSSATINGIVVNIERFASSQTTDKYVVDKYLKIVSADGVAVGTDHAYTSTSNKWPVSFTDESYGSSTDLWGLTLSPTDINDLDFGVALIPSLKTHTDPETYDVYWPTAYVNYISMTIYYTESSPIKTVNGLAKASVKVVNGLAIASVKGIDGLT